MIMKRILCALCLVLLLGGCGAKTEDLAEMHQVLRDDYAAIQWEDREYVPWGAVTGGRGKLLGYVDGDKRNKVYSYEDLPEEQWIANALDHDGIMLYREQGVTEIPGELGKSEYSWNQ